MVEKFVEKIIAKQLEEKTILQEDISIYKYGYTLVFEVFINIIIATIIGIISWEFIAVLLFLIIYIPLRSFCGGWHADKIWKCTIFSNLILLVMIIIDEYCVDAFTTDILVIIFSICLIFVFWLAPVDTKSKPISAKEKKMYKKKINIILLLHIYLMGIMEMFGYKNIVFVITFSYITQVVMLILEIANKKKKLGKENK